MPFDSFVCSDKGVVNPLKLNEGLTLTFEEIGVAERIVLDRPKYEHFVSSKPDSGLCCSGVYSWKFNLY